jgi:uncharacterized membrane protein YhfC
LYSAIDARKKSLCLSAWQAAVITGSNFFKKRPHIHQLLVNWKVLSLGALSAMRSVQTLKGFTHIHIDSMLASIFSGGVHDRGN